MTKNSISYYDFKFLDTSQISVIDLGTSFETYKVVDSDSNLQLSY